MNESLFEENLMEILGTADIPSTMVALHTICSEGSYNTATNGTFFFGNLRPGMYIPLYGSLNLTKNEGGTSFPSDVGTTAEEWNMTIMGLNTYKTDYSGLTNNHILWSFKGAVAKSKLTATFGQDWQLTGLGKWLNNGFKTKLNALFGADYLQTPKRYLLKYIEDDYSFIGYDSTSQVFSPNTEEVFGTRNFVEDDNIDNSNMMAQWSYYKNGNKVKNFNGTSVRWWLGTTRDDSGTGYTVETSGSLGYTGIQATNGVAPAFCTA